MAEPAAPSPRALRLVKEWWGFAVCIALALSLLVLGTSSGRVIGALLTIATLLLVCLALAGRGTFTLGPTAALGFYSIVGVVGVCSIGAGVYGFLTGQPLLAVIATVLGLSSVRDAYRKLRLIRTHRAGTESTPPARP